MHKFDINVFELQTRSAPTPAAGADFIITPNAAERIELLAVTFTFDAAAAGANRLIHMHHLNGTSDTQGTTAAGFIVANETINVECSQFMENQDLTTSFATITMPMPGNVYLELGDTWVSEVANIQALDEIQDIVFRCKVWMRL